MTRKERMTMTHATGRKRYAREGVGSVLALHLDKNNLPSVFASALLRPQPIQKPEWCKVKQ